MATLLVVSLMHNKSRVQTAIWAMELIFISAGLISIVVMVKNAVLFCSFDMVLCTIKSLTASIGSWLSSSLYICIVINLMIFLIAATSSFQHRDMNSHCEAADEKDESFLHATFSPPSSRSPKQPSARAPDNEKIHLRGAINREAYAEPATRRTFESHHSHLIWRDVEEEEHNERVDDSLLAVFDVADFAKTGKINMTYQLESSTNFVEFNQDPICRTENKTDREEATSAEDKKQIQVMEEHQEDLGNGEDSMEAMWKVITEGAEKSMNNQVKKSETWPVDQSRVLSMQSIDSKGLLPSVAKSWREMKKSVTFNDAISMRKTGGLTRDPSMSLDALNRRVEGFINKFNNALRIERQESEQRFLDMINRG